MYLCRERRFTNNPLIANDFHGERECNATR